MYKVQHVVKVIGRKITEPKAMSSLGNGFLIFAPHARINTVSSPLLKVTLWALVTFFSRKGTTWARKINELQLGGVSCLMHSVQQHTLPCLGFLIPVRKGFLHFKKRRGIPSVLVSLTLFMVNICIADPATCTFFIQAVCMLTPDHSPAVLAAREIAWETSEFQQQTQLLFCCKKPNQFT